MPVMGAFAGKAKHGHRSGDSPIAMALHAKAIWRGISLAPFSNLITQFRLTPRARAASVVFMCMRSRQAVKEAGAIGGSGSGRTRRGRPRERGGAGEGFKVKPHLPQCA